jgi:hypothetical protein
VSPLVFFFASWFQEHLECFSFHVRLGMLDG